MLKRNVRYIQEGRLGFGGLNSPPAFKRCRARLTADRQRELYFSDVAHIFQQLKLQLILYFR